MFYNEKLEVDSQKDYKTVYHVERREKETGYTSILKMECTESERGSVHSQLSHHDKRDITLCLILVYSTISPESTS
jgi:hypothetical protein